MDQPGPRADAAQPSRTSLRALAVTAAVVTFLLVAIGGLVRATGSGLGCSGWPKCTPQRWLPPFEYHALVEYSHRFTAFLDVVFIGILATVVWRRFRSSPRVVRGATAAIVLVIVQSVLGGIVVRGDLAALLVTAHFGTAMILVGVLVWTSVEAFALDEPRRGPSDGLARFALVVAGSAFVLLVVGAYVRGENAGLVFGGWPLMNGRVIPDLGSVPAAVQFLHRVLAGAVGALVIALAWQSWRARDGRPVVARFAVAALVLIAAQILVGAANVWSRLAPAAVASHVALAGLVWGALVAAAASARALPEGVTQAWPAVHGPGDGVAEGRPSEDLGSRVRSER